ncbi:MAG: hypothetical protein RJB66_1452 [Pseudomonadota bacterium]
MNALSLTMKALDFAARKHRDQRRKDHHSSPYINHPIALAQILVNEANIDDEVVIAAAILHDTIEDTDTSPEEIEVHFGAHIRSIVEEVTDDMTLPKMERRALQVEHAAHLSKEAALVKLADKIANLRDVRHSPPLRWTPDRKQEYREWAQRVIENIINPHPKLLVLFSAEISSSSNT